MSTRKGQKPAWLANIEAGIDAPTFAMTELGICLNRMGYKPNYDDDAEYVWVPSYRIREEYAKLLASDSKLYPVNVSDQLFGLIIKYHFPDAVSVNRRIGNRKKANGFAGITGPGQLRTPDKQGGRPHYSRENP
jgi:hypothetical protein